MATRLCCEPLREADSLTAGLRTNLYLPAECDTSRGRSSVTGYGEWSSVHVGPPPPPPAPPRQQPAHGGPPPVDGRDIPPFQPHEPKPAHQPNIYPSDLNINHLSREIAEMKSTSSTERWDSSQEFVPHEQYVPDEPQRGGNESGSRLPHHVGPLGPSQDGSFAPAPHGGPVQEIDHSGPRLPQYDDSEKFLPGQRRDDGNGPTWGAQQGLDLICCPRGGVDRSILSPFTLCQNDVRDSTDEIVYDGGVYRGSKASWRDTASNDRPFYPVDARDARAWTGEPARQEGLAGRTEKSLPFVVGPPSLADKTKLYEEKPVKERLLDGLESDEVNSSTHQLPSQTTTAKPRPWSESVIEDISAPPLRQIDSERYNKKNAEMMSDSSPSHQKSPRKNAQGPPSPSRASQAQQRPSHESSDNLSGFHQWASTNPTGRVQSLLPLCCNGPVSDSEEGENYHLHLPRKEYPYQAYKVDGDDSGPIRAAVIETSSIAAPHRAREALEAAQGLTRLIESPALEGVSDIRAERYSAKIPANVVSEQILRPAMKHITEQMGKSSPKDWHSAVFHLMDNRSKKTMGLYFVMKEDGRLRSNLLHQSPADQDGSRCPGLADLHIVTMSPFDPSSGPNLFSDTFLQVPANQRCLYVKESESFSQSPHEKELESDWLVICTCRALPVRGGSLRADADRLYHSAPYSASPTPLADCTLVCDKNVYPSSRVLLIARSTVFAEMLEGKSRAVIAISGAQAPVVKALVDYIHTDRCYYLDNVAERITESVRLFETAVRFCVTSLANEMALRLAAVLSEENVSVIETAARKTRHAHLLEAVKAFQRSAAEV